MHHSPTWTTAVSSHREDTLSFESVRVSPCSLPHTLTTHTPLFSLWANLFSGNTEILVFSQTHPVVSCLSFFFKTSVYMKYHSFFSTLPGLTSTCPSRLGWGSISILSVQIWVKSSLLDALYSSSTVSNYILHVAFRCSTSMPISSSACTLFKKQKSYCSHQ